MIPPSAARRALRLFVILVTAWPSPPARAQAPSGWILHGSALGSYETGTEDAGAPGSGRVAFLRSRPLRDPAGYAGLTQWASAAPYRGQRLAMTARLETRDVVDHCGLWLRIDDGTGKSLAFDDMQDRPVRGTSDAHTVEIVLDVPPGAARMSYGVMLEGPGRLRLDDVTFRTVGPEIPPTDRRARTRRVPPRNLDFEEESP